MASKSRAAQETLSGLEKSSAPFEEQLSEAWKFIGIVPGSVPESEENIVKTSGEFSYHGREEWLLRWLLKKLQSPKDDVPRQTPSSWKLLYHLVRTIPTANAAQILSERKFITILRQTLEEARKATKEIDESVAGTSSVKEPSSSDASSSSSSARSFRKRKRTGEVIAASSQERWKLPELLQAVSAALTYISKCANPLGDAGDGAPSSVFSAEYMKTVLTTTAEDSARILGIWLFLSQNIISHIRVIDSIADKAWFMSFIAIWELHTPGIDDLVQFSVFCSQHLLSLLQLGGRANDIASSWTLVLDLLVAQNIMIPAKAAKAVDPDSNLLDTLTRVAVIQDSANAALLLNIAIRSLQRTGSHRRRSQDNAWIQTVFTVLKDAMPTKRAETNRKFIQQMLQSAIDHTVSFDLPLLRSVISEYALSEELTDWDLLSTIIKLDANTLLIPDEGKDLLKEILGRITAAAIEPRWAELYDPVVQKVTIPIMKEFAKARDLSGFIRHWYCQLVQFEKFRNDARLCSISLFSAWEDDTLQLELSKLLEPSLTLQQIVQLLDWLSSEVTTNPNAVCVILEAIAGSITREDIIDVVGLRLYYIMFNEEVSDKLNGRYEWRSWRILSRTLSWIEAEGREELSTLWLENKKPFDTLDVRGGPNGLLKTVTGNTAELVLLEVLRFVCAAWSSAETGSQLQNLANKPMLKLLQGLANDVKIFSKDLKGHQDLGDEVCGSDLRTLYRGAGWMMWSFVRCVFVEYAEVLQIMSEYTDCTFNEMLHNIFWVASTSGLDSSFNPWLQINPEAFSDLWISALLNETVLGRQKITNKMIETMLCCQNHLDNPIIKDSNNNSLAIKSLLQVPIERFSRRDREHIMKSWLLDLGNEQNSESTIGFAGLENDVLALKIKIMQRPTFYEGMKFADLVHLAYALGSSNSPGAQIKLDLFKNLARSTLVHMMVNLDQARDRQYITDALDYLQQSIKSKKVDREKPKQRSDSASITLCEIVLSAFKVKAEALDDLNIINNKDLTKIGKKFADSLLGDLKNLLQKPKNIKKVDTSDRITQSIYVTIDALSTLNFKESKLAELATEANVFIDTLCESDPKIVTKVRTFMTTYSQETHYAERDVTTIVGRHFIQRNMDALTVGKSQAEKLRMLKSISGGPSTSLQLDQLLAARQLLMSCEDFKPSTDESDEDLVDLSSAYAELCSRLWRANGYRQFALTGETMELMLRTKGRAISQWNIDSTLGSISMICSRSGPSLSPLRAGSIYLHLCRLLQTILTSHRLRLDGHFHLVIQALQALLRCLATPLPHSNSKITKTFPSPPWLSASKHQLHAKHAEAFTRLISLICNPSVSSVTRSQHHNLTSATAKAKRMAGQHMQYMLTLYIKMQLDMKMLPGVREKMVPGIYAVFDTTTPELRRAISEGLDSSGRAVFSTLYRDYTRFGKWKGS